MTLRWWPLLVMVGCSQSALTGPGDGALANLSATGSGAGDLSGSISSDLAASASWDLAGSTSSDLASWAAPDLARSAAPDLAGATCMTIAAAVQDYLDTHATCQQPSDCAETTTNCGLPGQCGAYLTQSALGGLMSLQQVWMATGCTGPCPPCRFPSPATCSGGTCGPS